ncbi:hypothetical protein M3Y99_00602900 [Aphelenchoides fujianensis]|nr:hypothetical protein M3Y99_00602900 [Aphelenchoides fujianensis]
MAARAQIRRHLAGHLVRHVAEAEEPPTACGDSWIEGGDARWPKFPRAARLLLVNRDFLAAFTRDGGVKVGADERFLRLSNGRTDLRFASLPPLDVLVRLLRPPNVDVICDDENYYEAGSEEIFAGAYRQFAQTIASWPLVEALSLEFAGRTALDAERRVVLEALGPKCARIRGSTALISFLLGWTPKRVELFGFSEVSLVQSALRIKAKQLKLEGVFLDELSELEALFPTDRLEWLELEIRRPDAQKAEAWPGEEAAERKAENPAETVEKWAAGCRKLRSLVADRPFVRLVYRKELAENVESAEEAADALDSVIRLARSFLQRAESDVIQTIELHPMVTNYRFEKDALLRDCFDRLSARFALRREGGERKRLFARELEPRLRLAVEFKDMWHCGLVDGCVCTFD